MLDERIDEIKSVLKEGIPADKVGLESVRVKLQGKKGLLNGLYSVLRDAPGEMKRELGKQINDIKQEVEVQLAAWKSAVESSELSSVPEGLDMDLPSPDLGTGGRHPLSIIRQQLIDIFTRIGFDLSEGPHIADDWHNFTALNMDENHPARDMQDTFFVKDMEGHVLRTHTSSVQVRIMQSQSPPIRTISPGLVFRKDNDATHSPFFHQVEGLYVNKGVSFADLKQTLLYFVNQAFGEGTEFRLRPSYFPFTEPSAEMDIRWNKAGKDSWMEILGCGMVDPQVLENCGIDSNEYSGFAFGMGIERIAMLKYGISDIRLFYENDLRFLQQFQSAL